MNNTNIDTDKHTTMNIKDLKVDVSIKRYLNNCIENDTYKNMLFYGNPGTGKTTTANVFINTYIKTHIQKAKNKELAKQELIKNVLKLNASVFRNTNEFISIVCSFLESTSIYFNYNYKKIILLDEIDYMTQQGQKSLISVLKTFDNVIFICMCNYLSKITVELREYFLIFNYNCFGNLIKTFIKNNSDKNKNKLLTYILEGSDIRMYNNELYRLNLLRDEDIQNVINIMENGIEELYNNIINKNNKNNNNENDVIFENTTILCENLGKVTGICSNKIKLIVLNKAFERIYKIIKKDNNINNKDIMIKINSIEKLMN